MKKKFIALLICTSIIFTGCGSATSASSDNQEEETTNAESEDSSSGEGSEEAEKSSELDSLGDIEVDDDLFDVTITIPADYVSSTTQEELDAEVAEVGCKATLNDDGSATYVMTKKQHKKLMDDIATNINDSLNKMVGSEDYPNITSVTANSDFTEFTVTTKNAEPDMSESFAVMSFYMFGGLYHIFNGTTVDNIHVDYVNADSGEVISSADSSDMANE